MVQASMVSLGRSQRHEMVEFANWHKWIMLWQKALNPLLHQSTNLIPQSPALNMAPHLFPPQKNLIRQNQLRNPIPSSILRLSRGL